MLDKSKTRRGAALWSHLRGLWILVACIAIGAEISSEQAATDHQPHATLNAGPIDDALETIECILRHLLGLPCDHDTVDDPDDPDEPDEPAT